MVLGTKNNEKEGKESRLVMGHKLSSVGPGKASGNNMVYEPNNIDLAMKLHYLKLIYLIDKEAMEGISLRNIKESVFSLFNYYYESCGRFRRFENNGRPYIKCNDCGARFLEAKTEKTIQEWLKMEEDDDVSVQSLLLPHHHILGPELTYSPPLFLQITFFKCGGISLGLSWAHVLGDAFSMSNFMKTLAQIMNGEQPNFPPFPKPSPLPFQKQVKAVSTSPLSIKDVGPLGDLWTVPTRSEMDTYSFHVTQTRLTQLQAKLFASSQPFEALCAVIWQAIAKVTIGPKPNVVTVVKKDDDGPIKDEMALRNNQVVSSIKADFPVEEAHPKDLATLIRDWAQDERDQIGEMVDRDPAGSNFIVYGSKLTFVDLGEACFYGFEVKGISPRLVSCYVDGVGEDGVVLVLPGPRYGYGEVHNPKGGDAGRVVTLTLPKSYMAELKEELNKEWDLIAQVKV